MLKKILLIAIAISFIFCSCQKESDNLGEFEPLRSQIDRSQKNRFEERLFCKDWILTRWGDDVYIDGVLDESDRVGGQGIQTESLSLRENHTVVYKGKEGVWQYSYNHLLIHTSETFSAFEVVVLTSNSLKIRQEQYQLGQTERIPYFMDKSGWHIFWVLEYYAE